MKLRTKRAVIKIQIGDAEITAEQLTPKEVNELREEQTKWKGRGSDRRAILDQYELGYQMFNRMVKNWSGVTDEDGADLPCTPANKRLVYEYDDAFASEVLSEVAEVIRDREGIEGKN
jgi:hypothetical protein